MLRWGGAVAAMMVACRGRTEVEKTWCGGGRNQFAYALIALPRSPSSLLRLREH